MALDIYFREDIAEQIVSTAVGMLSSALAHGLTNPEYIRGILDFARAEALAYRIPWSRLEAELQVALTSPPRDGVLARLESGLAALPGPKC